MIIFHGDHLAPRRLCEILYACNDDASDIPLVFLPQPLTEGDKETVLLGRYFRGEPRHVEIYLDNLFECAMCGGEGEIGAPSFRLWYDLLDVSFHELSHARDPYLHGIAEEVFAAGGSEQANAEEIANREANLMISRLSSWDKRLFQPRWLGGLSVQLERRLAWVMRGRWNRLSPQWLAHYRSWKSGGQLSVGDVARLFWVPKGDYLLQFSNYAMIRRVASDLAYRYMDSAGRHHLFFDFGDVREIGRRLQGLPVCERKDKRH